MSILNRRLLRIIGASKGQFIAMAMVIAVGVSLYISIFTAYNNLSKAQQDFYASNNFADYYFQVVRAPESVVRQIEAIPGVGRVTGRIQKDVAVVRDNGERASARLTSYPLPVQDQVNAIQITEGRWFEENASGSAEVLTDPQFYSANQLSRTGTIDIIANGKVVPLNAVGAAVGPEFVYPVKDAANLFPDPRTFGIVMMPYKQCQEIFDLPGQVNQVLIQVNPGINPDTIVTEIESLLEPYGNLASYPRKDQVSHAILQGELDQWKAMSGFFPLMFLSIAAGIQLVLLRRMVKMQRSIIGVMKGLGYSSLRVIMHYTGYSLAVNLMGSILGCGMGLVFASYFSKVYAQFFNLPGEIGGVNLPVMINSFILALGVGLIAGLSGSMPIAGISPAESMRPQAPAKTNRFFLEKVTIIWKKLSPAWRMSLRSIARNRFRFAVTVLGVTFAVALLIISFYTNDATDYMMSQHYEKEMKYHYLVYFDTPVRQEDTLTISRLPGINEMVPFLEIPVKIHYMDRTVKESLSGQIPGNPLKSPLNASGDSMEIPERGIVLGEITARKLGARTGDTVTVETAFTMGQPRESQLTVVAINRQLLGTASFTSLQQANRLLQEDNTVTGCMLTVDPGMTESIEKSLSDMTGVNSVLSRDKERANLEGLTESAIYFVGVMILFSLVLGYAIIYNSIYMSFNERKRELASLLTLGFTKGEVAGLMFLDTVVQSLPGLLLGMPMGKWLAVLYINAISTDLYTLPVIIYPTSYILSLFTGLVFVILGYVFATRELPHLDFIEVTKNVE